MYAYLRYAQAVHPLRQVVLGLDTWQLGDSLSEVRPDFDPSLLYTAGRPLQYIANALAPLRIAFSFDTALLSLRTLSDQKTDPPDWLAADGQRLGDVFFHRPGEDFEERGPGSYFAEIDRQEIGFKLDMGPPQRRHAGAAMAMRDLGSLDYVRKIIAFCRQNGIDLRIFITPAHAHQMEISAAVGEWEKIEAGKRALAQMLATDAAAHASARPFPLWDFSGYSSVTSEPVPPPDSRTEMSYYWDSSHFKEKVGDWVLDRLFGHNDDVPADFGVALTAKNIDQALARIRADRVSYRSAHAADMAEIRALVMDVERRIPPSRRAQIGEAE